MTAHSRYRHATPSPRLLALRMARDIKIDLVAAASRLNYIALIIALHRIGATAASFWGPRGLRLLLNTATALLVLSLPFSVASNVNATLESEPVTLAAVASTATEDGTARASTSARGLVAGSRSVVTAASEAAKTVDEYPVATGDTIASVAEKLSVNADDLAYANGIQEEGATLTVGATLMVPPGRGALYFVKEGDTIAAVAGKFKVEPAAIMTYNRLYFEPEHFAPEQLIFVPGAEVPAMKRVEVTRAIPIPATAQLPARTGQLSLPVNGVFTQYFWWGHTGVDLAAPYGTGIMASDNGVVVATGWVAVGGLRVCVQHSGGLQTCYYHTSAIYVTPGQTVARGEVVAAIGMTGVTTGPHVHWEVKLNGVAVNPLAY